MRFEFFEPAEHKILRATKLGGSGYQPVRIGLARPAYKDFVRQRKSELKISADSIQVGHVPNSVRFHDIVIELATENQGEYVVFHNHIHAPLEPIAPVVGLEPLSDLSSRINLLLLESAPCRLERVVIPVDELERLLVLPEIEIVQRPFYIRWHDDPPAEERRPTPGQWWELKIRTSSVKNEAAVIRFYTDDEVTGV